MKLNNQYFIVRHGESVAIVKKIVSSYPEKFYNPLTKKGEKQIKRLAQQLKKEKIDLIFSSDILRTKQTAEIIGKELNIKPLYDKSLREINCGILNGKTIEEYENFLRKPDLTELENFSRRFKIRSPKGENYTDVQKRMSRFLKKIDKKYQNKKILIVSHGTLDFLEGVIKGFSVEEFFKWRKKKKIKLGECRKLLINPATFTGKRYGIK